MRRGLVCALVVPAICLAGCGGGDDDATSSNAQTTSTQSSTDSAAAAQEEAREAAQAERKKARARRYRRYLKVALRPQEGKSRKEQLRIADAVDKLARLAKEDINAVAPLLKALKTKDYARIRKLQAFYIRLGKPKSEGVLLDALYDAGAGPAGTNLALAYLQSDNQKLIKATRKWAAAKGYTITGKFTPTRGLNWGCLGIYRHRAANAPPTGLEC